MTMVALEKHSFAMLNMESLKSMVISLTFSRSGSGICYMMADTTAALVPLTIAMMLPFLP